MYDKDATLGDIRRVVFPGHTVQLHLSQLLLDVSQIRRIQGLGLDQHARPCLEDFGQKCFDLPHVVVNDFHSRVRQLHVFVSTRGGDVRSDDEVFV